MPWKSTVDRSGSTRLASPPPARCAAACSVAAGSTGAATADAASPTSPAASTAITTATRHLTHPRTVTLIRPRRKLGLYAHVRRQRHAACEENPDPILDRDVRKQR